MLTKVLPYTCYLYCQLSKWIQFLNLSGIVNLRKRRSIVHSVYCISSYIYDIVFKIEISKKWYKRHSIVAKCSTVFIVSIPQSTASPLTSLVLFINSIAGLLVFALSNNTYQRDRDCFHSTTPVCRLTIRCKISGPAPHIELEQSTEVLVEIPGLKLSLICKSIRCVIRDWPLFVLLQCTTTSWVTSTYVHSFFFSLTPYDVF